MFRFDPIRLRVALTALLALPLLAAACPGSPVRKLEPQLCLDLGAGQPNYGIRMPAAGPGADRPLLKLTLRGPESHANDGSPAIAYVRPAVPGSPDEDKWVIHFEGGGSCADADDCLERFCSLGTQVFDVAGKMSSLGAPSAIDHPDGMLALNPLNDFAGYNHVHLAYLSSDSGTGGAGPKIVTSPAYGVDYKIEFRGDAIVEDLIRTLQDGVTWPDPRPRQQYYDEALPDLRDAGTVILSGDSAGNNNLKFHLDRIADDLLANNRNPAGVEVLGVLDAGLSPSLHTAATVWNPPASPIDYADMGLNYVQPRHDFWETPTSALDESCLASGVAAYYCMDPIYTVLNEITTPVFVRSDLTDHLHMDRFVTAWGLYADPEAFAIATAAEFGNLPVGSGAFGPQCNGHVMIHGPGFAQTTTDGGTGLTFHDLLSNWVSGVGATVDVQADLTGAAPGYTPSIDCL